MALGWRVHRFGRAPSSGSQRKAIVVLGARVLADGTPSEALVARVHRAIELYRLGAAPVLVFSGRGDGPLSDALVAQQLALEAGVPDAACVLEDRSQSTFHNAQQTAVLLRARGLERVWLVTDDFHAYRSVSHFRRAGVQADPAPARRALSATTRLVWTMREVVALLRRPWLLW